MGAIVNRHDHVSLSQVRGLEAYWLHHTRRRRREPDPRAWLSDKILLDTLGLGLEQTRDFLAAAPELDAFRRWILTIGGPPDPVAIGRYHAWRDGTAPPAAAMARLRAIEAAPPALGPAELAQWDEEGYVVLRAAISAAEAEAASAALWAHLGAAPGDPGSWYGRRGHGIMVQLFQHPALTAARRAPRIHKAFAQLWGTADLWVIADRTGFNPPETPSHPFTGPHLHWDVSLATPIPFATQGMIYLTDTGPDQGALILVPGFHRRIEAWLAGLPAGADPRRQDLGGEARPIPGGAGDLVIWRQDLPHGASPNRTARPRLVHYLNMYSGTRRRQPVWR